MFDIDLKPTFTRPVAVRVPSGDKAVSQTFKATFQALDIPELTSFDLTTPDGTKKFLEKVLVGADELSSGGKSVEFTHEVRDHLIGLPWVRPAMVTAYFDGFRQESTGN